jgi:protease IV
MKRAMMLLAALGVVGALSGCTFLKVSLTPEIQPLEEQVLAGEGRDKVLVLDLSGMITSERSSSSLSGASEIGMVPLLREELDKARRDRSVKAVVLRINSPGGGVTASDVLYHEIRKFRQETGIAVIAHFMDVGASGAYYAALAADRITAQPTSVTGSIGVIMWRIDATGLMQKVGIQAVEIASGDRKGMGSPFRPVTPEEMKIFKNVVDSIYERFVGLIVDERKLPRERVLQLADGRIFTSTEAKKEGLIDAVGYLEDALDAAKKQAHLTQARVVTYSRPGEFKDNIYSRFSLDLGRMMDPGVQFMYIWWP